MKTIIQQTIFVNSKLKIGSYPDEVDSDIAFNSPWVAFMVAGEYSRLSSLPAPKTALRNAPRGRERWEAAVLGGYVRPKFEKLYQNQNNCACLDATK